VSYPKAGAPNPTVKLFYFTADDFALKEIPAPEGLDAEHLITSVAWANDDVLVSVWMNRVQNKGFVYKCTASECIKALTLDVDDGWIEFFTDPFFNANGTEMIFIAPHEDYRHVKVLDLNTLQFVNRTSGKFVVTEILKVNAKTNVILYTANLESDIKAQHVYAVKNENDAKPICLTCNLYKDHSYYSAEVSAGGNYIVINSNGPAVPRSDLYEIKVDGASISLANHMELENNNELKSALAREKIPNKQFDVLTLDNETEAQVMMIVPKDLDTSQKYPLLVEVYGGPDSSSVTNRFSIEWGTYLASSMGVIYAKIDGRGSGLRSNTHLHKLYKNLGTVEVDDQVRAARMLAEKYSYIDSSRMAIWGW
jgi:dipeptidyl-peptidase-4